MRVWSRIALVVVVLFSGSTLMASHVGAACPLSLADTEPAATDFDLSPHGIFRSNGTVYVLRGQILTTYATTDVGNLSLVREDYISSLRGREATGAVAFSNGHLFVSSEAGLEVYDLRNTRADGTAPLLVSRIPNRHYRRFAIAGNRLAALYPASDLPCAPGPNCVSTIDIFDISTPATPVQIGAIDSRTNRLYRGFNDIAFNSGFLIAATEEGIVALDVTNAAAPLLVSSSATPGRWIVSNGSDFVAVGTDTTIDTYAVRPGVSPLLLRTALLTLPFYLMVDRANPIRFNPNAWFDDTNGRLITMIDEVDPLTLEAARTIAFDVFDFSVPRLEGSVERIYEDVTLLTDDEVKHDATSIGPYVYVIGERTGLQVWGACGVVAGRIELDSPFHLTCGGAEIHGWVTGEQRIINVELFLGDQPLGAATVGGPLRNDVSASTPVSAWRINVNLDATARGEYVLRAVGTDASGNRRQFASKRLFFPGPGQNCVNPRRRAVR